MILTVTPNPAVDQTIQMDEDIEADAVQRSTGAQFDSGGNGINVSQFLQALGCETTATGFVGGFTGYFLKHDLASYDVETDFCDIDATTRMNTSILAPGTEYKINQSGPEVDSTAVDEVVEIVREHDPEMVNIGGSLPPGLDASAVDQIAGAGDWETAIEIHGHLMPDLEETYEYCKPNEEELEAATGMEIDSVEDGADAARQLHRQGFERVIGSLGSEGAVLVTPEQTLYASALDVDVVDTVGAGDSMLAAILWAYDQGWSDAEALKAGIAASAEVVSVAGPSAHVLDPEARMDEVRVWTLG